MKKALGQTRRKVAIFDIDGTIFRSSLLIEVTEALVQKGLFPLEMKNVYKKAYKNWADRKDSYDKYIDAVVKAFEKNIKGVDHSNFLKMTKRIVDFYKNRVYRYTRDLVRELKKKNYYILAISNSPKALVDEFCKHFGFDKVYGRIFEINKRGKYTGKIMYTDLLSDKSKMLKRAIQKENLTLKDSIGVGDSESDIPFLKMVKRPICFNPNSKLYQQARHAGWEIIIERKDVIYQMSS